MAKLPLFKTKNHLRNQSEKYHMQIHFLVGLACATVYNLLFPEAEFIKLAIISFFGSFLPDTEHIFFIFFYGRRSPYATIIKDLLKHKQIREVAKFMKYNHKHNTALIAHNILTPLLAFTLFYYYYFTRDSLGVSIFFLSWSLHYIYDILEDLLFFSKLNPNWWFKYGKSNGTMEFTKISPKTLLAHATSSPKQIGHNDHTEHNS